MNGSLNPMFSISMITKQAEAWKDQQEQKIYLTLCDVGERFANAAKDKTPAQGSFHDQTGNLRSSIGYGVIKSGSVQTKKFGDATPEGEKAGSALIDELAINEDEGLVLIGVAGMEYAAAVESKGKDVITGSVPAASDLLDEYKKELKEQYDL